MQHFCNTATYWQGGSGELQLTEITILSLNEVCNLLNKLHSYLYMNSRIRKILTDQILNILHLKF